MYLGLVALEASIPVPVVTKNGSGTPTNADSSPSYRVYGPSGLMTNGTGTLALKDAMNVTGLYDVQLAVNASNGYVQGQTYYVVIRWAVSSTNYAEVHAFTVT